ncbi:hypothetical protein GYMLUDRAFT_63782 [Collybiopsis luxurians FD-317 M1]|uniref:Unplaced genomic scaffold GYMLUscaffold_83, whole genome shotgun sequence n=1 Tax=Collybiopsis luxurians FD-317 M1 TaxID=944289 RepID=A0A0D0BF17_9AGAR|nr:hypothetical protein GYMLUDRAFT_63782 [Collybiopsis luxurians FD-317 M1]
MTSPCPGCGWIKLIGILKNTVILLHGTPPSTGNVQSCGLPGFNQALMIMESSSLPPGTFQNVMMILHSVPCNDCSLMQDLRGANFHLPMCDRFKIGSKQCELLITLISSTLYFFHHSVSGKFCGEISKFSADLGSFTFTYKNESIYMDDIQGTNRVTIIISEIKQQMLDVVNVKWNHTGIHKEILLQAFLIINEN